MSASALVSGRLFRDPERKVSKAGKPFVTAKLREGASDAVVWWSLLAFDEGCREELLRLRDGDAVAVSGPFTVTTYERNGEIRLNHSIVAERLISAQRLKKHEGAGTRATRQPRRSRRAGRADIPLSMKAGGDP
jgi:single-stranded DNA-binding protein